MYVRTTISLFLIVLSNASAIAVPLDVIRGLDYNRNGLIEDGVERNAVRALGDKLSDEQIALITEVKEFRPPNLGVPVSRFDPAIRENKLKARCESTQSVFLRKSTPDISVLYPNLVKAAGSGAAFSMTQDRLARQLSWNVKGALAIAFGNPCVKRPQLPGPNSPYISAYAVAPYVDFIGKGTDTSIGPSMIKTGLQVELEVFSGLFDIHHIKFSPYYQTDFNGNGNIYGFKAIWSPVKLDYNLGGYIGANKPTRAWWSFDGILDYQKVNLPGDTKLTAGTENTWLGANLAFNFEYEPKSGFNTFFARASYEWFHDFSNSNTVDKLTTTAGVYLDKKKLTSLQVNYEVGTDYETLANYDQITLDLTVGF